MKILAQTVGNFMLMDNGLKNNILEAHRPGVVVVTQFVNQRLGMNQIQVLQNDIPESAEDADFEKFWVESYGDEALAIESFLASLNPPEEKTPVASTVKTKKVEA